jgi:RNA 2',3'-cyclic 3'-phosphodiesterase
MSEKKRLFAGIKVEFNERTRTFFSSLPEILDSSEVKWVALDNIHITLKFFGDVEVSKIPQLVNKLETVSKKFKASEILLKGLGVFKDFYHPKVIWFGLRDCPGLETIKNEIENTTGSLGFEIDYRKFMPHLTVGRFKSSGSISQLRKLVNANQDTYFQVVPVNEIVLFESILKTEGPEYKIVKKFVLGSTDFEEFKF